MLRPFPAHCSKGLLQSMPVCPAPSHIGVVTLLCHVLGLAIDPRILCPILASARIAVLADSPPHSVTSQSPQSLFTASAVVSRQLRRPTTGRRPGSTLLWGVPFRVSLKQVIIGRYLCQLFWQTEKVDRASTTFGSRGPSLTRKGKKKDSKLPLGPKFCQEKVDRTESCDLSAERQPFLPGKKLTRRRPESAAKYSPSDCQSPSPL
jgi:hypothetical protein